MTALFFFLMSLDTVDWYPIDAGIVTYEITDVNCSFGVLERAVLFEDIQAFIPIGVLKR
jgi:hypothetical protein